MWGSRKGRGRKTVICIACGNAVLRSDAREYDKHGNRWDREDKTFEHLCKDCFRDLCHQPRGELESLLVEIEDEEYSRPAFLTQYCSLVEERYGPLEERGS